MLDATSKALFHSLAQVKFLQRVASRYGMAPNGFARRFIAGESVEEAAAAVRPLAARGMLLTLDYLGESVRTSAEADVARVNRLGARIRLVKGAYKEPKTVAYQKKSEVDAAFVRLMEVLLDSSPYPAIATHDPAMIDATKSYAAQKGYAKDRFEFQMLYGVRRDLQASLVAEGYRMRIYVPFGQQWYPYFMRRLGERPANVWFVLKSLFREQ